MQVTLPTSNGDIVIVVKVEHEPPQDPRPPFDCAQGKPRTSWSERRFAEALDTSTSLKAGPSTPLGASR